MRTIQKVELVLACIIPVAALASAYSMRLRVGNPLIDEWMNDRFSSFFVFVLSPVIIYSVLGAIAFFAARRDSVGLTTLFCLLLMLWLVFSGFLVVGTAYFFQVYALLFYCPAPVLVVLTALVSFASRVGGSDQPR